MQNLSLPESSHLSIRFSSKPLPFVSHRYPQSLMPPFSLEYAASNCDQSSTILVTRDNSRGSKIRSSSGQKLWNSAQDTLDDFFPLLQTVTVLHIRLDGKTRDHRRTYCTVRAPGGIIKYSYKFFCGIGEWVATEVPGTDFSEEQWKILPRDFYGRKSTPISLEIFWGLNGLLRYSWYPSHGTTCRTEHYDVFINIFPDDMDTSETAKILALSNPKKLTHLQVCADAKVTTLFQMLIGPDKATKLSNLAHCLAKVHKTPGTEGGIELGPEILFEDVVRNGITMQETGWFVQDDSCLLVSTKRCVLNSKSKHTFMFQEALETKKHRQHGSSRKVR